MSVWIKISSWIVITYTLLRYYVYDLLKFKVVAYTVAYVAYVIAYVACVVAYVAYDKAFLWLYLGI